MSVSSLARRRQFEQALVEYLRSKGIALWSVEGVQTFGAVTDEYAGDWDEVRVEEAASFLEARLI